eukprot:scaffold97439_cov45-Attheya_sp.AAC.1
MRDVREPNRERSRSRDDPPSVASSVTFSLTSLPESRASSRKMMKRQKEPEPECDPYLNPTRLFELINYGEWDEAEQRAILHPVDARTWIASRKHDDEEGRDDDDGNNTSEIIDTRYLPLHLACLLPDPPYPLVKALFEAYPEGVTLRDHSGNLPIHYACSNHLEGGKILDKLIHAYPASLGKTDNKGRKPSQIIDSRATSEHFPMRNKTKLMSQIRLWQQRFPNKGSVGSTISKDREKSMPQSLPPRNYQHQVNPSLHKSFSNEQNQMVLHNNVSTSRSGEKTFDVRDPPPPPPQPKRDAGIPREIMKPKREERVPGIPKEIIKMTDSKIDEALVEFDRLQQRVAARTRQDSEHKKLIERANKELSSAAEIANRHKKKIDQSEDRIKELEAKVKMAEANSDLLQEKVQIAANEKIDMLRQKDNMHSKELVQFQPPNKKVEHQFDDIPDPTNETSWDTEMEASVASIRRELGARTLSNTQREWLTRFEKNSKEQEIRMRQWTAENNKMRSEFGCYIKDTEKAELTIEQLSSELDKEISITETRDRPLKSKINLLQQELARANNRIQEMEQESLNQQMMFRRRLEEEERTALIAMESMHASLKEKHAFTEQRCYGLERHVATLMEEREILLNAFQNV